MLTPKVVEAPRPLHRVTIDTFVERTMPGPVTTSKRVVVKTEPRR